MAARQAEARKLQQNITAEQDPAKRQKLQEQFQQVTGEIRADQMKAQTDFRQRGMMKCYGANRANGTLSRACLPHFADLIS